VHLARRAKTVATLALFSALLLLAIPAAVRAADSIYWANAEEGTIRVADSDGSGAKSLFSGEDYPQGVSLDLAAGKIYWADTETGTIRVGNLDGSGSASTLYAEQLLPRGVAIDASAGKIYWADDGAAAIQVGNLDGSGAPVPLYQGEGGPWGVAIDPSHGKIYWADTGNGEIRAGNLDGSGTATSVYSDETTPIGMTVDPSSDRLYWSSGDSIRSGDVSGGDAASTLFGGEGAPEGAAIDLAAEKLYWANAASSGSIRSGNLSGGGASTLVGDQTGPTMPALLRSPAAIATPQIGGDGEFVGDKLSCGQGEWSADVPGAFLFRQPVSFTYQWLRDNSPISAATQPAFTPSEPGTYSCRVSATNQAGSADSTSQPRQVRALLEEPPISEWDSLIGTLRVAAAPAPPPPAPSNRFSIAGITRDAKRGVAKLTARVPGPGLLRLSAAGARPQQGRARTTEAVELTIRPRGGTLAQLRRQGHVRLRLTVTFTPAGGAPRSIHKSALLLRR
jgi:hypothetical protein